MQNGIESGSSESYYIHGDLMLKNLLKIIRWPNLIILAGIQLLSYFRLMDPSSSVMNIDDMVLLVLITILLGAGGYVINDYYDTRIDRINKPGKWIAGNLLTLGKVRTIYFSIVLTGFILSVWLAIRLDLVMYLFIYPFAVAGLWLYSYALKCRPFIGNIWVSLFCAGVIVIVALPDILLDNKGHIREELWLYMTFAFISTWIREVVKDIEDVEGDAKANCRTAVVRFGLKQAKIMVIIIGLMLIGALLLWENRQENHWVGLILTVLQGFTAGAVAFVIWAKNKSYYHHASTIIKFVMVGGTLILFLL